MSYFRRILDVVEDPDYVPVTRKQLSQELGLKGGQIQVFNRNLDKMLREGSVVRIKKDRISLPRDADLESGVIRFRQSGNAYLIPDVNPSGNEAPKPRLQIPAENTWVAMDRDRVVARLEKPTRHEVRRRQKFGFDPDEPSGKVIRILERGNETLTGTLKRSKAFFYVIPDNPCIIQDIIVPDPGRTKGQPKAKVDDKVLVKLDEWKQRHLNPEGEIIEVLGKSHTPDAEQSALFHTFALSNDFPPDVMKEVERIPDKVPKSHCKGRLDCRDLFTFTIDPDDAKDFDDALSIEDLGGGTTRVGIHIADVSHYVKANSALDKEAQKRGNSTYLVGQVVPMLPFALSNGLCSLVEGEDRLTKTVFLDFDQKGRLMNTAFANSVIRSDKRLTYKMAYALLKESNFDKIRQTPMPPQHQTGSIGKPMKSLSNKDIKRLREGVLKLWSFAEKMRRKRIKDGSLDLDMPEVKIFVDENGYAERLERVENDESHQLIEEFMLVANEEVDKALHERGMPLLHRVHDKPDPEKLDELRELLLTHNIEVGDLNNRREINKMLERVRNHPRSYTLRIEFLRSLKKACYRASADGHYGLNKKFYSHFTSPIRRYCDLVVHRIFDRFMLEHGNPTAPKTGKVEVYRQGQLQSIAAHISLTEINSTEAERESVKTKMLEFFEGELKKKKKTVFDAVITDTRNHGLFIELTETTTFGLIHISTLDDFYTLQPDGTSIRGKKKKKSFSVGDHVPVVVERVDRFKKQIDFRMSEK